MAAGCAAAGGFPLCPRPLLRRTRLGFAVTALALTLLFTSLLSDMVFYGQTPTVRPPAPFQRQEESQMSTNTAKTTAGSKHSAGAASQASDVHGGTMTVPLARLVESDLPSRTWFEDRECVQYDTRFGRPGSLPDARLASFFRSGNTWTRYLLETATGFFTCGPTYEAEASDLPPAGALPSVEELRRHVLRVQEDSWTSPELRRVGFVAENVSPSTRACVVGKTHAFPPAWRRTDGGEAAGYLLPAILLVRDPFKSLISLRHYHVNSSTYVSESRADRSAFTGGNWTEFVIRYGDYWFDLSDGWASSPRDTLVVHYEKLEADPERELKRMLQFLQIRPSPGRMRCTVKHIQGMFANSHPVVPDKTVYTEVLRTEVWARILHLNTKLTAKGYERLPVEKYAFFYDM